MPTPERRIRDQEDQIPELAEAAGRDAYHASLASGNTVLVKDGPHLVEVSPDGDRRVVKEAPPRVDVKPGTRYRLR